MNPLNANLKASLTAVAGALVVWALSVSDLKGLPYAGMILSFAGLVFLPVVVEFVASANMPERFRAKDQNDIGAWWLWGGLAVVGFGSVSLFLGYKNKVEAMETKSALFRFLETGEALKAARLENPESGIESFDHWTAEVSDFLRAHRLPSCQAGFKYPQDQTMEGYGRGLDIPGMQAVGAVAWRNRELVRCIDNPH